MVSPECSSWFAYRLAMSKSSLTVLGGFLDIFLRRSGSLTPFRKVAMTTALLTLEMEFFFLMNHRVNSRRDSPFFWWIRLRSHSTPGFAKVPWKLLMNLAQRSPQELIEFPGSPVSQSCTAGDSTTGR